MAENKNKKNSTKKRGTTTSKNKSRTVGKNKKEKVNLLEEHRNIVMLVYLATGILFGFFAFIKGSNIWTDIRSGLFAFFGITLYLFVAYLIVIGIQTALNNFKRSFLKTNISYISIIIALAAFIHLFSYNIGEGGMDDWSANFSDAISVGLAMGEGDFSMCAGILGAVFGGLPLVAFGKAGAFVIVILCLIISILYTLRVSVSSIADAVSGVINSGKVKIDEGGAQIKVKSDERKKEREAKKAQKEVEAEKKREAESEAEQIVDEIPVAEEIIIPESVHEINPVSDAFDFNNTEIENGPSISEGDNGRKFKPYQPGNGVFTYPDKQNASGERGTAEKSGGFSESGFISSGRTKPFESSSFKTETDDISDEVEDFIEIIDDEEDDVLPEIDEIDFDREGKELSVKDKKLVKEAADSADAKREKNKQDVENYKEQIKPKKEYVLPPIDCLNEAKFGSDTDSADEMRVTARKLVDVLQSFGVETKLIGVSRGPSVTRYELSPAPGVKISKITNLSDDIALGLASSGVRIEAPIPNKSAVGIEVPNKSRATVTMREMIASEEYTSNRSKNKLLNVALGKDITGNITCADLSKMPHLLIAGTTGSGKSVCLNVMIASILYNATPAQVKLLMIDPKQVEFTVYNGIPHLLVPVISDARKAAGSLAWAVGEMDARYKTFSSCAVRDIGSYNKYAEEHPELNLQYMPQIVIFIDELNDLMMVSPKEVEDSICRLAQKARAAGMHLVVATQRPSVDVITGIIKANIPSRISLSVSSQVDSRTILDAIGAEKLLGNGDMLFNPVGMSKPVRIQGAYLSDAEIERIVTFIKEQEKAEYDDGIMEEIEKNAVVENKKKSGGTAEPGEESQYDVLIEEAMNIITGMDSASTTVLQRKLSVGYARAARIMDQLEQLGYISPAEGNKPRRVLVSRAQFLESRASGTDTGNSDDYDILSD